jgi:spore maturation protein CgeB
MNGHLSFRIFAHSWISDWNHGNAHFLRGLASELVNKGHEVRCYEPRDSWSIKNLAEEGQDAVALAQAAFRNAFPMLDVCSYDEDVTFRAFTTEELRDADVVLIHEWNSPEIVKQILSLKPRYRFHALFHDTHHRAYTNPKEISRMSLHEFDGVLAFGDAIRRIYSEAFGVKNVWTFHEGSDIGRFFPKASEKDTDVVWIGNWGDEERTSELREFLMTPAAALREHKFAVQGVRYPQDALEQLSNTGIEFRGYLPNLRAPDMYAHSKISLHVPRRFYANGLSGIPTIRVFEALAAGSPLVCAPWNDSEGLFRAGEDYIRVSDSKSMIGELRNLLSDDAARQQLAASGLQTILARHTCAHRADQLLEICHGLEN